MIMKRKKQPKKISENLSSVTLFTFTSEFKYLSSMLLHGIKPRYIFEHLPYTRKNWNYIMACKCFCDIPLGKIKSHLEWFGYYGLGINKNYLQKKGVSPVLYIHSKSQHILKHLESNGLDDLTNLPAILPYLKRYYGTDVKPINKKYTRFKVEKRKFYDEREWRYVPNDNNLEVYRTSSKKVNELIQEGLIKVKDKNLSMPYEGDSFEISPDNIEYIIIEKQSEFEELKKQLHSKYTGDKLELLISKVLIAERIVRDF